MSWSFHATGRPQGVINKAKEDFAKISCAEPEETIRLGVLATIEKSLGAMPADVVVQVTASGSQSVTTDGKFSNTLNVAIQPLFQFVE